jgi:hypothetical protein
LALPEGNRLNLAAARIRLQMGFTEVKGLV